MTAPLSRDPRRHVVPLLAQFGAPSPSLPRGAAAPAFALPLRPSLFARTGSLPLPLLSPPDGLLAPAAVELRGRPAPPLLPPSGRCETRGHSSLSIWAEEQGPLRRREDQGAVGSLSTDAATEMQSRPESSALVGGAGMAGHGDWPSPPLEGNTVNDSGRA
jgi:hypothetical protein